MNINKMVILPFCFFGENITCVEIFRVCVEGRRKNKIAFVFCLMERYCKEAEAGVTVVLTSREPPQLFRFR